MRMLYQNMHLSFIKKRALALFLLMKRRYNQSIKLSLIPWVYKPKLYICFPKFNKVFHCFTPIQCKYVSTRLVSFRPPVYALKRMNILTESSFFSVFLIKQRSCRLRLCWLCECTSQRAVHRYSFPVCLRCALLAQHVPLPMNEGACSWLLVSSLSLVANLHYFWLCAKIFMLLHQWQNFKLPTIHHYHQLAFRSKSWA